MENNTRISESCYSSLERSPERAETDSFNSAKLTRICDTSLWCDQMMDFAVMPMSYST